MARGGAEGLHAAALRADGSSARSAALEDVRAGDAST